MADFTDDLDILNYALTLEHFEAAMYRQIVSSGRLTGDEQRYAQEFGAHEEAHVAALTNTIRMLGGTPVAAQARYNFPAFDTRDNIVRFLVTVEDLGAGAYLAAAPEVRNLDVLQAAVAIHNIEGEHASIWRRAARLTPVEAAFATPVRKADVLAAVTPFLAMGGGTAAATTPAGTARPAGTGGGVAATPATMTLPQTGVARPQADSNTGTAAAVAAGIAAVGVGALLRARSYKRGAKAS